MYFRFSVSCLLSVPPEPAGTDPGRDSRHETSAESCFRRGARKHRDERCYGDPGQRTPEAKKGNELALKALSDQINPRVPVTVLIILEPLAPNLLGLGGGSKAFRDF